MQHIILKKELSQSKLDELLSFLKGLGVDVEVKSTSISLNKAIPSEFNLNTDIWNVSEINSVELRKSAWSRK